MIVGQVSKQPGELFPVTINFTAELATGETVSTAVVTVRNAATGADTSSTIKSGAHTVSSPNVTQKVTAGGAGDTHILTIKATTSSGNVYEGEIALHIREE